MAFSHGERKMSGGLMFTWSPTTSRHQATRHQHGAYGHPGLCEACRGNCEARGRSLNNTTAVKAFGGRANRIGRSPQLLESAVPPETFLCCRGSGRSHHRSQRRRGEGNQDRRGRNIHTIVLNVLVIGFYRSKSRCRFAYGTCRSRCLPSGMADHSARSFDGIPQRRVHHDW